MLESPFYISLSFLYLVKFFFMKLLIVWQKMKGPMVKILITGIQGLIGSCLEKRLIEENIDYYGLDKRAHKEIFQGDILNDSDVEKQVSQCTGILHLAAVSRVIHGEENPEKCWQTNTKGTRNILRAALRSFHKPWIIYASSREVYGQQAIFPVREEAKLSPLNTYGFSKVSAEMEMLYARNLGLKTAIVRFSNVYGDVNDHPDRVIPAFINQAMTQKPLRVDGTENSFDFTHVEDVVTGLLKLIQFIDHERSLNVPTLHFVSGQGTSLRQLAEMICQSCQSQSEIYMAPPRSFDVHTFVGDPQRSERLLDWKIQIPLKKGVDKLVSQSSQKVA